jgi:PilZ domain
VASIIRAQRPRAADDRRTSTRLQIEQDVRYKVLLRGKREREVGIGKGGIGKVLNISSAGVLFSTEATLTVGELVELTVSWPARLNQVTPLKLVTLGRVVRSDGKQAAIAIEKYAFKTRGPTGL